MCKTILNLFFLNFVSVSLAMEDSDNIFDITQTNSISDQPNPLLFKLFNFLKDVPNDTLVKFDNSIEEIIEGLKKEDRVNKSGCPEGRRPRRLQLEDFDSAEMKRSRGLEVGQDEEECVEDIKEENINQSGDVENDKSASEENSTNFDAEEDKTMENIANEVDERNEVLSVSNDETTKLFVATTTDPLTNSIAEVTIEKIFEEDEDSKKAINGSFDHQNFTQRLVENSSIETKDEIVEITTIETTTESEQETSTSSSRKMTTDEITPVEVTTNKIMTENKPETSTLSDINVESTTNEALTQNVQDTDELTQITENKTETSTIPIETVTQSQKENSTLQNINGKVNDDVIKIQPVANSQPENSSLEINDIINDVFKINITTNEIVKVDTESVQPVTESQQENPTSVEKVEIDITTVQSLVDNQQEENITKSQKNSASPDINETTESTISTSTTKPTDEKNDIPEMILSVITEAVPSELTTTKTTESSLGETPTTPMSSPITGSSPQITTTIEEETLATDETTLTTTMEETSESVTFSTEVTVKTTTEKPISVDKTTEKTTETADEIPTKTTVSIDETTAPAEMPTKTTVSIDETTEPANEMPTKTTVSKDETTEPADEMPTKTTVSIDETTESITTETTRKVPSSLSETSTESETLTEYDTSPDHRLEPVFPDTKPSPVSTSHPAPERSANQWQHQLIGSLVVLVAVLAAVFIVVKVARKNRAVSGSYKPQKREMALEEFKVEMDLYRDNYPKGERLI